MSEENVNGADIFGSGSHVWTWGQAVQARKDIRTVGTTGQAGWPIQTGGRPGRIAGVSGPAVLKVSDHATKALADSAMDSLETAIEDLRKAGTVCTWEDDAAHSGEKLQIVSYRRIGRRLYTRQGADWGVWREYICDVIELSGDVF